MPSVPKRRAVIESGPPSSAGVGVVSTGHHVHTHDDRDNGERTQQRIGKAGQYGGLHRAGGALHRDRGGLHEFEFGTLALGSLDVDLDGDDPNLADGETRGGNPFHDRMQGDVLADQTFEFEGDGRGFDAHDLDIVGQAGCRRRRW